MKKVILCDDHAYFITDDDFEKLKVVSPGMARLVRNTNKDIATHFVCDQCGQIPPLKLRKIHKCKSGE